MPVISATQNRSEAEITASVDRRFDRLAWIARQIAGDTRHLPAMLADIEQQRRAVIARACAEKRASCEPSAGDVPGPVVSSYWCDACQEAGATPVCAYCARPVIDTARDLIRAGERLGATVIWADREVAELEARWARNRAARQAGREGVGRRHPKVEWPTACSDPNGLVDH